MRNHLRGARTLFALSLLLVLATPVQATWHANEEIPVESPVYGWLDDLATSYPVASAQLQVRPWTRADLGRFLDRLVADHPEADADALVARLRRELAPSGGVTGLEPMIAMEEDDLSLEVSPYLMTSFTQDESRESFVRDYRGGAQASLAFGSRTLLFADAYVGTVAPGPHGTPDAAGSFRNRVTDVTHWADRGYLAWFGRGVSLRVGRTWLRWGPGAQGSLALSDGAPAMDLVEARLRLPREAQLTWFLATLDPVQQTYLTGHRVSVRVNPRMELGVSGLLRFDGTASAPLYLLPIVPLAGMDRRVQGGADTPAESLITSNLMVAADLSWQWRPGVRVYGELAVDDFVTDDSRPRLLGLQAGLHLRRRHAGAWWTLRSEYTRVTAYTYSTIHAHDFEHRDHPTGYPWGPDVGRWFNRLEYRPGPTWVFGSEFAFTRKGAGRLGQPWVPGSGMPTSSAYGPPAYTDTRFGGTADFEPSPAYNIRLAAGVAQGSDVDNVAGRDKDGPYGSARMTLRW